MIKAVPPIVFMANPKNDVANTWHHSIHVLLLGDPVVHLLLLKSSLADLSSI